LSLAAALTIPRGSDRDQGVSSGLGPGKTALTRRVTAPAFPRGSAAPALLRARVGTSTRHREPRSRAGGRSQGGTARLSVSVFLRRPTAPSLVFRWTFR